MKRQAGSSSKRRAKKVRRERVEWTELQDFLSTKLGESARHYHTDLPVRRGIKLT